MDEIIAPNETKKLGGLYLGGVEPAKNLDLIKSNNI